MPAVRVSKNQKLVRSLGLMASASIMSITMAGEAHAACTTNNAQPVGAVTINGTIVTCTGAVSGQTVQVNANDVAVEISGGGTNVSGGSNIFAIGEQNVVFVRAGATLTASTVYTLGASSGVVVQGNVVGSGITVDGDASGFILDTGGTVTVAPGNLSVFGSASSTNNITLRGTLTGSSSTGSYLLRGGNGQQRVFVRGAINVQADGLAMNLGDDNDEIYIQTGANISGGTGNNILFNGGAGIDRLQIDDSGISNFNSIGIETLVLNPGAGGFRGLSGSHADVTQFSVGSGTVNVTNLAALGQANSNVLIVAGAQLNLSQTSAGTFNHVLAGSGTLALNSGGAAYTFGGIGSTFNGTFVIGAGNTAIIATSDALGTASFNNLGTVSFGDLNLNNNISGTGQVIYTGAGTGDLSGVNTFSGGLDIRTGSLRVANVNALGTGTVTSSLGGAILQVDNANDQTLANNLTGALVLVKTNSGILDLTGTNSYTGGTLIDNGAVRVDAFARLGTGQVITNANGSVILDYNGAGQLLQTTQFMTGSGRFIKEGTGDVVMNQTSTYTGGTIIRAGRIGLNNGDALGTGAVQIDSGAELGVGGIILNNNLTGSGLVRKTASNTVELYGDNSGFTGTIHIADGDLLATNGNALGAGTLQIDTGTSVFLNAVADSTMAANLTGDGTFEKAGTGRVTVTGNGTLFGGAIAIQNGILQIEGDQNIGTSAGGVFINSQGALQIDTAANTNLATVVYGSGRVVKSGSGTVFVTGANNYSGGTDIQQGAIRVTDVSFLGTGAITVQAGAALDLSIAGTQTLNQAVSGAGILRKSDGGDLTLLSNGLTGGVDIVGGRVIINTAAALGGGPVTTAADTQLVFDNSTTEIMSNVISGAGSLTKDGSGVLVIQNASSYTGGTVINAGRLGLNNGQGLGAGDVIVLSGAQLSLGGVTVGNNISGAGQVVKTANNIGTLTGTNSYSGGTDVQGGTLTVNSPAALGTGAVSMAAGTALAVNYSGATNVALNNLLTGAGALIKDGSGTVVINNGTNNYSGGTTINSGRLGLNFGNGLGTGAVTIGAGATLALGDVTYANATSGAGQIVKTSAGLTNLTGTNTHSGGIAVQAGTLAVSGNASLGTGTVAVGSGATFEYANTAAATFSNGLSGAGTFNKLGAGQLSFANNFSIGSLTLGAGRTRINTVGTTNVTVGANATLDGTGRIIGNLTNNGIVAPGNSIGTLTVQGNYLHNANSILEIEFDGAGNIDLLDVTGNATLNGGTLRFVSIGGAEGQGGTFLRTGGSLTGTFATVETVGAQLPLAVVYEPNRAFMAPSVLTARPSTFNAQSMAAADTALGFIDSIGVGDVRHGEGNRIWLNGFGAWGKRSASGSTLAYDHDTRGMSGGVNFDAGGSVTLGAAIGWAKGDITLGANGGGGDQSSILGSLTARYTGAGVTIGGGVLYGKVDQDTLRNVSFNGFAGSVDGETDSKLFGAFAELGVPLGSTGGWAFSANARGSYVRQKQDGYTESGTSPLRLTLGDLKTSTMEGQARLTAKTRLWDGGDHSDKGQGGLDLRVDLGGRYLGTLGDREIPVAFAVSGASIVLQGDTRNTLQGLAGLALDYTTRSGATFSFGYRGEVGKTDRHALQAGVSFAF